MEKDLKTFDELRAMAIEKGVADNNVSVGLWAKIEGWKKIKRVIRNNKFVWLYEKGNN